MEDKSKVVFAENIKGVFFDLYGTLLVFDNFDKANLEWENTFYELTGKKYNLEFCHCQKLCKDILELNIEKDSSLGLTTYETKIKRGLENYGIELTPKELKNTATETIAAWQKEIMLAGDAIQVIRKLKQEKTIGLITNFDHTPHIKRVLKEMCLEELFDFVIVSDEAGYEKPSPKIFNIALEKSNLQAGEVVYVGDNIHDDIEGAASVGIKPILISRKNKSHFNQINYPSNYSLPKYHVINSLSELLEMHF